MQEDIRQYYCDVESLLVCNPKTKRRFLGELRNDVQAFIKEHEGNVSMEDIQDFFGTPETIASGFLETLVSKDIKKAISWKKVLLIGIGLVILALALWIVISLIDGHLAATGSGDSYLVDYGTLN